jgi:hypothetical protein
VARPAGHRAPQRAVVIELAVKQKLAIRKSLVARLTPTPNEQLTEFVIAGTALIEPWSRSYLADLKRS